MFWIQFLQNQTISSQLFWDRGLDFDILAGSEELKLCAQVSILPDATCVIARKVYPKMTSFFIFLLFTSV